MIKAGTCQSKKPLASTFKGTSHFEQRTAALDSKNLDFTPFEGRAIHSANHRSNDGFVAIISVEVSLRKSKQKGERELPLVQNALFPWDQARHDPIPMGRRRRFHLELGVIPTGEASKIEYSTRSSSARKRTKGKHNGKGKGQSRGKGNAQQAQVQQQQASPFMNQTGIPPWPSPER